jgi:hypothetical protein
MHSIGSLAEGQVKKRSKRSKYSVTGRKSLNSNKYSPDALIFLLRADILWQPQGSS